MIEKIKEQISNSILVKEAMIESCIDDIKSAASLMIDSIRNGGKILWCGNGGSAADAQHLATELMGGMTSQERKPIPSIALTTDSSFITAWSNDHGYENIFIRWFETSFLKEEMKDDTLIIGMSCSGNSKNITKALSWANQ